jgi:hypothetical protein
MRHPEACTNRLYLKKRKRGRNFLQIAATYKAEIINIAEYMNTK